MINKITILDITLNIYGDIIQYDNQILIWSIFSMRAFDGWSNDVIVSNNIIVRAHHIVESTFDCVVVSPLRVILAE